MYSYKCKLEIDLPRLLHSYPLPKRIARRDILIKRLKKMNIADNKIKISNVDVFIPDVDKPKPITFVFTFSFEDTELFRSEYKMIYSKIVETIECIVKNFKI